MVLEWIDWLSIVLFFLISLLIGVIAAKRAGRNASEFFLSGRDMPWWLLGISMVATTFSADTPNLVTDIVRKNGVAGNWVWWAFLLTGMLTVFVYAKLWRRLGVMTDLEFYELRYSGKEAAFLRGFRAIYLGVFFNMVIMATVCLAAIKIGAVLLNISPGQTLLLASIITVAYSCLGGLRGVIWTDFLQFGIAMVGAIWAAVIALNLPEVGGLEGLLSSDKLQGKLNLWPDFSDHENLIPLFILPLAVQWWSVWYPGSEPGGGGYVAQRMLSAKSEKHAIGATLLFNVAHYALRPWPWIIVALCSLLVYPDLASLQAAFPHLDPNIVKDDLAYPAMMTFLPHGLLGLVLASLIAAFMSTISTHLNWGSSYIVNDFYQRFISPQADEKRLVLIGRISTIFLMILAATLALFLQNALQGFQIMLQIGAGTGLLFILRWFWWRINAYSEITAMVVSFLLALYFQFGSLELSSHVQLCLGVAITTVAWVLVTLITPATKKETLYSFYRIVQPAGPGWKVIINKAQEEAQDISNSEVQKGNLSLEILAMVIGCFTVYSALFGTGYWIYGKTALAITMTGAVGIGTIGLFLLWKKIHR